MAEEDWLKERSISADKILIARQCKSCGGTPQMMPEKHCYSCAGTGREVFFLSDCWWIDTSVSNEIDVNAFKARHGVDEPQGGPRVHSRKI